ncbi:nuclear transcription factor Y subunit A-7-like [Pyrus ussuriensis x Pyrus communis]|uniref:Nuclear transcription factor Y subunit n=1 Tax=Pyrus ussuriensis x Pyrus communis TaxID=2448454 RepID=A0A5N5FK15_9ROSA|nr:nuclear transcription factor Y subunit A-7-like [Pyrus ussuriensis x Pyrus communis]
MISSVRDHSVILMTSKVIQSLKFIHPYLQLECHILEFQLQICRGYPYPDPYYRSIFAPYETQPYPPQPYAAQPTVHLQLMGIQQAGVPLPSDAVEEPVFVNAKQYHGILRRRQSRAKAESENKALKNRKKQLQHSRGHMKYLFFDNRQEWRSQYQRR